MVEGLLSCANFTSQGRRHPAFVQAGAETSDTGVEGHQIVSASSFELLVKIPVMFFQEWSFSQQRRPNMHKLCIDGYLK